MDIKAIESSIMKNGGNIEDDAAVRSLHRYIEAFDNGCRCAQRLRPLIAASNRCGAAAVLKVMREGGYTLNLRRDPESGLVENSYNHGCEAMSVQAFNALNEKTDLEDVPFKFVAAEARRLQKRIASGETGRQLGIPRGYSDPLPIFLGWSGILRFVCEAIGVDMEWLLDTEDSRPDVMDMAGNAVVIQEKGMSEMEKKARQAASVAVDEDSIAEMEAVGLRDRGPEAAKADSHYHINFDSIMDILDHQASIGKPVLYANDVNRAISGLIRIPENIGSSEATIKFAYNFEDLVSEFSSMFAKDLDEDDDSDTDEMALEWIGHNWFTGYDTPTIIDAVDEENIEEVVDAMEDFILHKYASEFNAMDFNSKSQEDRSEIMESYKSKLKDLLLEFSRSGVLHSVTDSQTDKDGPRPVLNAVILKAKGPEFEKAALEGGFALVETIMDVSGSLEGNAKRNKR